MRCDLVRARLSAYLDSELSGAAMYAIRDHLEQCPECREDERSLRAVKSLLSQMDMAAPEDELYQRLKAGVNCSRRVRATHIRLILVGAATAFCAASLWFVTVGSARPASPKNVPTSRAIIASEVTRDRMDGAAREPLDAGFVVFDGNEAP